jgi:hypothetical protein
MSMAERRPPSEAEIEFGRELFRIARRAEGAEREYTLALARAWFDGLMPDAPAPRVESPKLMHIDDYRRTSADGEGRT